MKVTIAEIQDLEPFQIPGWEGLFVRRDEYLYLIEEGVYLSRSEGYSYVKCTKVDKGIIQPGQRLAPFRLCPWLRLANSTALRFRKSKGLLMSKLGRCRNPLCNHTPELESVPSARFEGEFAQNSS